MLGSSVGNRKREVTGMKEFACGAVVPGCAATFEAETEQEILEAVSQHAKEDHGMDTVPAEVAEQVKANISDR